MSGFSLIRPTSVDHLLPREKDITLWTTGAQPVDNLGS
jgi:hypothetical protein